MRFWIDEFSFVFGSAKSWPKIANVSDNSIPGAIFGWGRREERGAREEKEEGLLRTVDCVFKS